MNTLKYLSKKYNLNPSNNSPIEIPNVGKETIPLWLKELNFKKGVEVGILKGEYGELLSKESPQMTFWGIDCWEPYEEYGDFKDPNFFVNCRNEALKRLSKYPNYKIIESYSKEALSKFRDNSLDFVYIDANHEEPYISKDIIGWSKKVKKGGIIAGDDYYRRKNSNPWDVKYAVNKFVKENNIKPWFLLGTQAKIPGMVRDKHRNWMYIKK